MDALGSAIEATADARTGLLSRVRDQTALRQEGIDSNEATSRMHAPTMLGRTSTPLLTSLGAASRRPEFEPPADWPVVPVGVWTALPGLGCIKFEGEGEGDAPFIRVSVVAPERGLIRFASPADGIEGVVYARASPGAEADAHTLVGSVEGVNRALGLLEVKLLRPRAMQYPRSTAVLLLSMDDRTGSTDANSSGSPAALTPFHSSIDVLVPLGCGAGADTSAALGADVSYTSALTALEVRLSQPVDRDFPDGLSTEVGCEELFEAESIVLMGGEGASDVTSPPAQQLRCRFDAMDSLTVFLAPGSAGRLLPNVSQLLLKPDAFAPCASAAEEDTTALAVPVRGPVVLLSPEVSLHVLAEPCVAGDVVLRARVRAGPVGFGAVSFVWNLPDSMAAVLPASSTPSAVATESADGGASSVLTIPARFFAPGSTYSFAVRARNWIGVESAPVRASYLRPTAESALHLLGGDRAGGHQVADVRVGEPLVLLSARPGFSFCAAAAAAAMDVSADFSAGFGSGSNNNLRFEWSVDPPLPSVAVWESWLRTSAVLAVETAALELTQNYSFTVRVVLESDERIAASLVQRLRVLPAPPRAIIRGSSVVNDAQEFILDGSSSTGASGIAGPLFFRWSCARPVGPRSGPEPNDNLCVDSQGTVVAPPDASAGAGSGAGSAVLGPMLLPIGRYIFTLSVWTGDAASVSAAHSAQASLVVLPSPRLYVAIRGAVDTSPGGTVQLEAVVTSSARVLNPSSLRYEWSQVGGALLGLTRRAADGPTLTLNPLLLADYFLAGPEVQLRCVVRQDEADGSVSSGESVHTIRVNTPPTPGQIVVSSPTGESLALVSEHTLVARGFTDLEGDAPLSYMFFYERAVPVVEVVANETDSGGNDTAAVPSSGADRRVYINIPSEDVELDGVMLPQGAAGQTLTVGVLVRDSRGATTVLTTALEVALGGLDSPGALLDFYKGAVAPALATADATRVLYLSALVADRLADLTLVEPASPELVEMRSVLHANVVAHVRGQPALLAGGALAAVLRTMPLSPPQETDAALLLSLLGACENLARTALDFGASTQEFRDRVAGIVHRALEGASAAATSSSSSVQQEFAPVVERALAVSFALLAGQSKDLIAQSQLLIQSSQSEQPQQRVTLGLFRSDGVRLSHLLLLPLTAGGDLGLNASSDSAMPAVPVDYAVVVTDSNPLLAASLAPGTDANSSTSGSIVSGGAQSATPSPPVKHLLPALVAIHAHYARTDQALASFVGQTVVVHVPYAAQLCTLPPRRASQICAPHCLVWNATGRAWSDDPAAVRTLLSADSVALGEARCQIFLPGTVLGVGQRVATRPGSDGSEDAEDAQGNSPPSSGVFSAQGLSPGGTGFYIIVFLSAAVFAAALVCFALYVRRYRNSHPADAFPWLGMFPGSRGSASAGVWSGPGAPGLPARRASTSWVPPPLPPGRRRSEFLTPVLVPAFGDDAKSPSPSPSPPPPSAQDSAPLPRPPASSPSTTVVPGHELLSSPTGTGGAGTATPSALADFEQSSSSPSVLSAGEMLYPPTFVPPRRGAGVAGGGGSSGTSTTEHSTFSVAHGSTTHTPLGRVFHYGSSSNASSARGSRASSRAATRPGSKAASLAGSKAGSRAGSTANSRAQSRRVSPERGQLLVTVPAGLVHIPRQTPVPDRRTSFIIGEMDNEANAKIEQATQQAVQAVTVAAATGAPTSGASSSASSQSSALLDPVSVAREAARQAAEQMSRRASSHFANLESVKGVAAVYSKEAAAPRATPPSMAHAPSYKGVAASGIRFAAHVKKQITNVRDLDANGNPVPVPESESEM